MGFFIVSSRVEEVATAIINGIKNGKFVPNQRLVEADLTKELNISRGPLREAFKLLDAKEIIHLTPNQGARIKEITIDHSLQTLAILKTLSRMAISQFSISENSKKELLSFSGQKNQDITDELNNLAKFYLLISQKETSSILYSSIKHLNVPVFARYIVNCLKNENVKVIDNAIQNMVSSLLEGNRDAALKFHEKLFDMNLLFNKN